MNNKQTQNAKNKNYPQIPPKEKKVRKTKIQHKTAQAIEIQEQNPMKTHAKRRVWFGEMKSVGEGKQEKKHWNNSGLCGQGGMCCKMLWYDTVHDLQAWAAI